MISDHIQDIITAMKAMPNSLHRNKAVSHAEDSLAHMLVLEMELYPDRVVEGHTRPLNGLVGGVCICPDGAIDKTCPVHGS